MVSFTAFSAAAVLAFSGMASAIPAYTFTNGTTSHVNGTTTTGVNGTTSHVNGTTTTGVTTAHLPGSTGNTTVGAATDAEYCPKLNAATVTLGGKQYFVECGKTHFGTQIQFSVGVARRAVYNSLGDCINLCSSTATCVGTAFDLNARTCTLYSDVEAAVAATGIDFAFVVANGAAASTSSAGTGAAASTSASGSKSTGTGAAAGTTVPAGGVVTIPVYSTTVKTVLSCAASVTNCPLRNNGGSGVVTELIPVTSTVYTCPAATTLPSTPLACTGCPYVPVTATEYSACSTGGTTSFVPVATAVVNYPMPTGTAVTVTVCTKCAASTSGYASSSGSGSATTSSHMSVYTGAADSVKAGMGFAAFVAGAAILI